MVLGMSPPLPLYPKTPFPPHQQTQLFNCYSLYIVIYRYIYIYIYYNIGGRASGTNDNHIYIFISTSMQPHAVMESPVRGSYGVPHLLPIPAICACLAVLCFHVCSCGFMHSCVARRRTPLARCARCVS